MVKIPVPTEFDWDTANINKNQIKHGVHFKEAEEVFFNKPLLTGQDAKHTSNKERRFSALGKTDTGRKLAVFFTVRDKSVRIISTRDQNKKERQLYEKA